MKPSHIVTYRGAEMTVVEAIRASGVAILPQTVYRRLQCGWPLPRALAHPVRPKGLLGSLRPMRGLDSRGDRM